VTVEMRATRCRMRCAFAIAIAALVGIVSLRPGAAQGPPKWAKDATPGVQLTLQETKREHTARGTEVTYRIVESGLPDDKTYQLWAQTVPGSFRALGPVSEVLLGGTLYWTLHGYVKGEAFRIIVTSTDRTVQVFAEVYPFPIEGKDGSCRLWVEPLSHQGTTFAIYGEGFGADEDVTTISQSGGESIRKAEKAHSDGTLPVHTVAPAVIGKQSGTATFIAAGQSCAPTVNYEWGPPAMKVQ
jgi:hypothetical protein